jgi:hypothetical protein
MILRQTWFFFVSQIIAWAVVMMVLVELGTKPSQAVVAAICLITGGLGFVLLRKRYLTAPRWVRGIALVLAVVSVAAIPMAASSLFR